MEDWKNTKCGTCTIQRQKPICNSCMGHQFYKPMSNADKIRNMNDEELAKFIRAVECCSRYGADCGFPFCPSMEGNLCNGIKEKTEQYILDWLQSEVKGSDV